jgi:hypothetical protein
MLVFTVYFNAHAFQGLEASGPFRWRLWCFISGSYWKTRKPQRQSQFLFPKGRNLQDITLETMRNFFPSLLTDKYSTFTRLTKSRPFDRNFLDYVVTWSSTHQLIVLPAAASTHQARYLIVVQMRVCSKLWPWPHDLIPDRLFLVLLDELSGNNMISDGALRYMFWG